MREGVARVSLDVHGESVNTISKALRDELSDVLARLGSDAGVRAVVLISGKPESFIAGADISEFASLESRAAAEHLVREGQALIGRLAALGKPVVAAIHGACLGGGLEAALACTYRVATDHPRTALGLPEVQLGVIPAAGGCQRLPRLIGVRAALDIILAGKTVPASRALRIGIVDELVHPAILDTVADVAARRLATGWRPAKRPAGLAGLLLDRNPIGRAIVFATARRTLRAKTGGQYPAPPAALDAVATGLRRGVAAGLDREATAFADLAVGDVSRKLVQIFFATTALKKDKGVDGTAPPARTVRAVGVVGSGFMGSAIAGVAVAQAGVDVRMRDADVARVARGVVAAQAVLRERLGRRRITRFEFRRQTALLSGGADWSGFRRADLVIEAVFEDLAVKHAVFRDLEGNTREDCVLASNTSTIPIARIAEAVQHSGRVIGMHFFSPVDRMPLLEVIVAPRTSAEATVTAVAFGRRMGKTVIVVKDSPGFWVNRILAPYINEAAKLVEEGVDVETVDRVMRRFGFPVGPLTLLDEVGLDVGNKASGVLHQAFGDRMSPIGGMQRLLEAGYLGRKNGRGFYRYERGRRRGVDPEVYRHVRGTGERRGPVPEGEVEARLVYVMLNEAARAVDEGVVRSPRDGDIGAVYGIGYPPFRGGPLRYLDDIGAARAVETLVRLSRAYGSRFEPAPRLTRMASSAERFHPARG